jgi:metallophosphoesterase superfamily enzyme
MRASSSSHIAVGKDILLDGRLALFHKRERWLAVVDLHLGYELSQRAAGNLFPLWGMQAIEKRLEELLREYNPPRLIILGDLVHDRAGAREAARFINRLSGTDFTPNQSGRVWLCSPQGIFRLEAN